MEGAVSAGPRRGASRLVPGSRVPFAPLDQVLWDGEVYRPLLKVLGEV